MKIRYGCNFGGSELVVIQLSEEMADNVKLARELKQVIEKENIRRAYKGQPKIAYKITTSEKLVEQFPDVAAGDFKLTQENDMDQQLDLGRVFFTSNPVVGKE